MTGVCTLPETVTAPEVGAGSRYWVSGLSSLCLVVVPPGSDPSPDRHVGPDHSSPSVAVVKSVLHALEHLLCPSPGQVRLVVSQWNSTEL